MRAPTCDGMVTGHCDLLRKFARVCLKTRQIGCNGQLCMVSAAAGTSDFLQACSASYAMARQLSSGHFH